MIVSLPYQMGITCRAFSGNKILFVLNEMSKFKVGVSNGVYEVDMSFKN
jgi:hypothetical protein